MKLSRFRTASLCPTPIFSSLAAGFSVLVVSMMLSSCSTLITEIVISPSVDNIQKQEDLDLVCEGMPAYLLMIDSLIESYPDDDSLLLIGAKTYTGASAALKSCNSPDNRVSALSLKAKRYSQLLLDHRFSISGSTREHLENHLASISAYDADFLFWGAFGWLTWIQQQQGSPASMADLVVVERLMAKVLELDETIENGSPHLFFGALYGAKPEMIGGDPERSRKHFERALEISDRSMLMVQVTYAETYCRMIFNQKLHDDMLQEVLNYPLEQAPDNTLPNQIAKRRAKALLAEGFFD